MTADTLIYNLYRALSSSHVYVKSSKLTSYNALLDQAHKYLEERNLLDQNEED